MNLPTIRSKTLYVSASVFSALKAIADVEGRDSPDAVADKLLEEMLAANPINARRVKLVAKAMGDVEKQLRDEFDDKLPMQPVTE